MVQLTAEIRIGPERHNYVYQLHVLSGVYRCVRPSDWGAAGEVLCLFRTPRGEP